ncbi:MAG: aspartate/glutamate racemase family protein [Calditrichia bacterium]
MKKLGLIGGTSWHSTIEYYRTINQAVNNHFGDNTNPPLLVYTMNQSAIHRLQKEDNWAAIAEEFITAAISLQRAGAEAIMLCANTPHKIFDKVSSELNVPMIHIADATGKAIKTQGVGKVCFIGTKFTMAEDYLKDRISQHDIEVLAPNNSTEIDELHRIIHKELSYGNVVAESKVYVMNVIKAMLEQGAKGVILGCTEFPIMIASDDLDVPIFNTAEIHAKAGAEFILQKYM